MMMDSICSTPNCGKPSTLKCPVCAKIDVSSYFCSQECFKGCWKTHKALHAVLEKSVNSSVDDRFAGYMFTGTLRPGKKSATRTLPDHIGRPDYAETGIAKSERESRSSNMIIELSDEEAQKMRKSCRLAREVLDLGIAAVGVGVTTDEIDRVVHEACIERDCYPSPLNYYNFPKSCCTSINEVICHGIPDSRPLQEGDILNLDITTYHDGHHGDVNETVFVGQPSIEAVKLVKNAYDCLAKSMDAVKSGMKYRELGEYISRQASAGGFSVVRTYSGHGIHHLFHCPPSIPHYARNKAIGIMRAGHCFTIEPMINAGAWRDNQWPDNWTAVTIDGRLSAQFEHTMLMVDASKSPSNSHIEVLTKRPDAKPINADPTAEASLSDEDLRHFQRYGRPHFIDQLDKLGSLSLLNPQ